MFKPVLNIPLAREIRPFHLKTCLPRSISPILKVDLPGKKSLPNAPNIKTCQDFKSKICIFCSLHPLQSNTCQTSQHVFFVLDIHIPGKPTFSLGETVQGERGLSETTTIPLGLGNKSINNLEIVRFLHLENHDNSG